MTANRDEIAGKLKQAAGDLTDNRELHREGSIDKATGKAKRFIDKLRRLITSRR